MVGDIAQPAVVAHADEPLSTMVSRMAQTGRSWLPVVSGADALQIVGEISLDDTLKASKHQLQEEQRRERILPLRIVVPRWLRSGRV